MARLCAGQPVEAVTYLGPWSLSVRLNAGPQEQVAWRQGWLTITLDATVLIGWPQDEREGFVLTGFGDGPHPLILSIQKDYKCTKPTCEPAQPDAFDWPR